jgi:hypothetical protein
VRVDDVWLEPAEHTPQADDSHDRTRFSSQCVQFEKLDIVLGKERRERPLGTAHRHRVSQLCLRAGQVHGGMHHAVIAPMMVKKMEYEHLGSSLGNLVSRTFASPEELSSGVQSCSSPRLHWPDTTRPFAPVPARRGPSATNSETRARYRWPTTLRAASTLRPALYVYFDLASQNVFNAGNNLIEASPNPGSDIE